MSPSRTVRKKPKAMPLLKEMCGTCPFRKGSPTEFLKADLTKSALSECSRVCHSTGSNNAFHHRTGRPQALCRGARDVQLAVFHAMGMLDSPTDAAWDKKCREMGLL